MSNDDSGIFGRPDDGPQRRGNNTEAENSVRPLSELELRRSRQKSAGEHLSEGDLGGAIVEGVRSLFKRM